MEHETQINSIVKILRESLEKLKISLILPQIFENHLKLQQHVGDSKYIYCIKLIEEYIREKVNLVLYILIVQLVIIHYHFRQLALEIVIYSHI